MRSSTLILLIALLAAPQAFASTYYRNDNKQAQGQAQGQHQGQDQSQSTEQSQTAGGGESTLTDQSSSVISYEDKRDARSPDAPAINATVPCYKTGGFSLGFPGGGGAIGAGKIDKACEEREVARLMAEMGAVDVAMAILCVSEATERTIGAANCLTSMKLERIGAPQLVNPPPAVIEVFTNLVPACEGGAASCPDEQLDE